MVAAVNGIAIPVHTAHHHAPLLVKSAHVEYDAPAHYDFSYAVHDEHTGDIKSQHESRKGDAVHGSYSLIDSDGFKRTVEYTADDHHGFNAVVHREPTHVKIPVAHHKIIAAAPIHHHKVIAAAPVYHHAAPAAVYHHHVAPAVHHYAAPVAKIAHYAPVAAKVVVPVHHGGYGSSHVSFSGPASAYHY